MVLCGKNQCQRLNTKSEEVSLFIIIVLLRRAPGSFTIDNCSDSDASAITFHEIVRYDPINPQGKGIVIAVFDRNATGMLAPFNGMIVTGIHDEPPNAGVAIIKLWEWRSGIPISTSNTAAASPIGAKFAIKLEAHMITDLIFLNQK